MQKKIKTEIDRQLEEAARQWINICIQQIQDKQQKLRGNENGKPKRN